VPGAAEATEADRGGIQPPIEHAPAAAVVRSGFQLEPEQHVFAYVHGAWHPAVVKSRDRRTVVVDYELDPGPLGARPGDRAAAHLHRLHTHSRHDVRGVAANELVEVRWLNPTQVHELMPDLFDAVRDHLDGQPS
jgi:hypothetical protein